MYTEGYKLGFLLLKRINFNSILFVFYIIYLQDDLQGGEDIARCPSCSLRIKVIFGEEDLEKYIPVESTTTTTN